jgi:hypothetical protein
MIYFKPSAAAGGSEEVHMSLDIGPSTASGYERRILYMSLDYYVEVTSLNPGWVNAALTDFLFVYH